ncbi:hypothetical protein OPQ81_005174 [Rhizoctonia solani]|nr:hypothetical protein OPQ81_005174 [Rhizoctonia solani]
MTTSHLEVISHERFRILSQRFFEPYPPYVLVNSQEDAKLVVSTGCEPGYVLVLDADGPSGTKALKSNDIGEFRGRVGIVIYTPPLDADLPIVANRILELLEIDGAAIGFATSRQVMQWKQVCMEWAEGQEARDTQGKGQDGTTIEWSTNDVNAGGWIQWSMVKKAPEWAFC